MGSIAEALGLAGVGSSIFETGSAVADGGTDGIGQILFGLAEAVAQVLGGIGSL